MKKTLTSTLSAIVLALSACGSAVQPNTRARTQQPTPLKSISLDEGTNPLYRNVPVSSLRRILRAQDTDRLASYNIAGATPTRGHQYLDFRNSQITPVYAENERDEEGNFAYCDDGRALFTHITQFDNGLQSAVNANGNLTDIEGKTMKLLGDDYTVSTATQRGTVGTLTLRSPQRTIEITDSNSRDNRYSLGDLRINGEQIEDAFVYVKTDPQANGQESISRIDVHLTADARLGDMYIPVNGRLSEQLDERAGMISDKWDLEYRGPRADGSHDIRFIEK